MKFIKNFKQLFESVDTEDLGELYEIRKRLERKIDDFFGRGQKYTHDEGYQELLQELEEVEEEIERLELKNNN